jgi:hypothetical protein
MKKNFFISLMLLNPLLVLQNSMESSKIVDINHNAKENKIQSFRLLGITISLLAIITIIKNRNLSHNSTIIYQDEGNQEKLPMVDERQAIESSSDNLSAFHQDESNEKATEILSKELKRLQKEYKISEAHKSAKEVEIITDMQKTLILQSIKPIAMANVINPFLRYSNYKIEITQKSIDVRDLKTSQSYRLAYDIKDQQSYQINGNLLELLKDNDPMDLIGISQKIQDALTLERDSIEFNKARTLILREMLQKLNQVETKRKEMEIKLEKELAKLQQEIPKISDEVEKAIKKFEDDFAFDNYEGKILNNHLLIINTKTKEMIAQKSDRKNRFIQEVINQKSLLSSIEDQQLKKAIEEDLSLSVRLNLSGQFSNHKDLEKTVGEMKDFSYFGETEDNVDGLLFSANQYSLDHQEQRNLFMTNFYKIYATHTFIKIIDGMKKIIIKKSNKNLNPQRQG